MHLKFLPLSVECTDGPPPDVESLPHPLCAPGFDGYHSNSWPRVDLWGTLPTGQRATVHVHGCFPYFYARPLEEDAEAVRAFSVDPNLLRSICTRTAAGLDEMLRNSDGAHGTGDARVRSVTVATLTPFYGYHPEPLPFLRVALYRARDVVRAAKLLLDEGCCKYQGRALRLQPYESHVNAHMKFFADVGAGALRPLALDDVRFRRAPKTAREEGWVSEATVREAGVGYAPTKRRLAAPTLAADDAVEVDVAFARVSAATSVRGDDDYAVPALRELFDAGAWRLAADVYAPLVCQARCCTSFCELALALAAAALHLTHVQIRLSCSRHESDQSLSLNLAVSAATQRLQRCTKLQAVQPDRQRCGGGSARRSCCSSARP